MTVAVLLSVAQNAEGQQCRESTFRYHEVVGYGAVRVAQSSDFLGVSLKQFTEAVVGVRDQDVTCRNTTNPDRIAPGMTSSQTVRSLHSRRYYCYCCALVTTAVTDVL